MWLRWMVIHLWMRSCSSAGTPAGSFRWSHQWPQQNRELRRRRVTACFKTVTCAISQRSITCVLRCWVVYWQMRRELGRGSFSTLCFGLARAMCFQGSKTTTLGMLAFSLIWCFGTWKALTLHFSRYSKNLLSLTVSMDKSWDESSNKIQMIRGHMGFYGRYGQNKLSETSRRDLLETFRNLSETSRKPLGDLLETSRNLSETSRRPLGNLSGPLGDLSETSRRQSVSDSGPTDSHCKWSGWIAPSRHGLLNDAVFKRFYVYSCPSVSL